MNKYNKKLGGKPIHHSGVLKSEMNQLTFRLNKLERKLSSVVNDLNEQRNQLYDVVHFLENSPHGDAWKLYQECIKIQQNEAREGKI